MPKSDPEYERGFTDGFNSRQRDVEQFEALRKAATDALIFIEEHDSAETTRQVIGAALRRALGKEQ